MKAVSLNANNHTMMDSCAGITPPKGSTLARNNSCTNCYSRLLELKKQAMKHMMVEYHKIIVGTGIPSLENLLLVVYQNLKLTEQHLTGLLNQSCTHCGVNVEYLKNHALLALQTANFTPFVTKSMMTLNQNDQLLSEASVTLRPTASHGEASDTVNGRRVQGLNTTNDCSREVMVLPKDNNFAKNAQAPSGGSGAMASPTPAQFFAEAAKKFNIPSKRKSKKSNKNKIEENHRIFPTDFSFLIKNSPPPNPPGLFKYMGRRVDGKVSVMLRISASKETEQADSFIEVDQRRKQISVLQPKNTSFIPPKLQTQNSTPKLFGFDAIFEAEMLPSRVSSSSLLDVLHAVVNGGEGCLLVYGASGVGKSSTMVGRDESNRTLGFIPAAIAWLYSLMEDCKQRTGARISVRVSAVEVIGQTEQLKDLLSEQASCGDSGDSTGASPGIYLREDPIGGTVQLGNVSEPQAVSAEKAAFYLDAALAARSNDKAQNSHMIFTVHVYQYRVEKNQRRGPGGAVPYSGGRSRLHLIDLSCFNSNFDQMQNGLAPSHAGLGQIIVAMLNGFKQVPYKDSKITRLLKDSIGNPTCRTTLVAHVSAEERNYAKTFSTLQTVTKIQRSRRKRNKYCSSSSDNTSCDESSRRRRPNPAIVKTYGIDDSNMSSDYNTSSAGEDSCDTVIYMGSGGQMSDRDLSDNERPPSPNTFRAMKLKLTSSSEDETPEVVQVERAANLKNRIKDTTREEKPRENKYNDSLKRSHQKSFIMEDSCRNNDVNEQHDGKNDKSDKSKDSNNNNDTSDNNINENNDDNENNNQNNSKNSSNNNNTNIDTNNDTNDTSNDTSNDKDNANDNNKNISINKSSNKKNINGKNNNNTTNKNINSKNNNSGNSDINETNNNLAVAKTPLIIGEKVVNIVSPLVINELSQSDSNLTSSPSTEISTSGKSSEKSRTSLVKQIIENGNSSEVILIPNVDKNADTAVKAPSEKELRKREKRIAKLLKETMSDDVTSLVSINNKKNIRKNFSGYTSDNGIGNFCQRYAKLDGYISAPENNRCKPVQAVKGIVRQSSTESSTGQQLKVNDINNNSNSNSSNNSRELLKNWVQSELMKHLREMEAMKEGLENMSNAIPPSTKCTVNPNETLVGSIDSTPTVDDIQTNVCNDGTSTTVDCVSATAEYISTPIDNISTTIEGISTTIDSIITNICKSATIQFDCEGTSVDNINTSIVPSSVSTSSTSTNDNTAFSNLYIVSAGTSVDTQSSIETTFSTSINTNISPKVASIEVLSKGNESIHCKPTPNPDGVSGSTTTTFGIESQQHAGDTERETESSFESIPVFQESSVDNATSNKAVPKIQNLNHVITVSAIPNFAVATREPLLNQLISSPQVQRNSTRTASIANTKYYKGSSTSVDQDWCNRPVFERSYSKEDTCSLVSVNESEAYDSDNYSSSYTSYGSPSYTPSPVVERKEQRRPTRLKYRWSTVFEEEENKKEKTLKSTASAKSRKEYSNDNELEIPASSETPKPSRFSKSPKKEKDRRMLTLEPSLQAPQTSSSSKCSDKSPKGNKKFQLLSPRSDRRMKDTSSDKRNSGCSDASSGIGSSSSQSQSSSLHSNEDILVDEIIEEKESPVKSKYWPFSRNKSRKYRSPSGYMSDGNITDTSASSRRRSRFFGSRSKSFVYNDGHSSGYDTSITEGGMTSCNEDHTDTEGGRSKKKKRFLGFRRRSTNDLNTSRGRYKKPIWFDSRRCQSDDEDVRIKVYNIDEPRQLDRQICKSESAVSPRFQLKRIEELKKERGHLKSEHHLGLDKFQSLLYTASSVRNCNRLETYGSPDQRLRSNSKIEEHYIGFPLEKEDSAIGKKLRTLKNHIQVVTCFDTQHDDHRKVTRI